MRRDFLRLSDFEDFDVTILQLYNAVMRTPGMAVARADGKDGARIKFPPRRESADGVHDMVETVRHRRDRGLRERLLLHRRESSGHQQLVDDVADDLAV